MARSIVALFPDRGSAERAIGELKAAGFDPTRMGLVLRDPAAARGVADEQGISATAGAVTGGIVGGTAGTILAASGALIIPGIGPFITAGVLASLASGTAEWLIGSLIGMDVPRDEAEYYQAQVEQGSALVTVDAQGRDNEARRILLRAGAQRLGPEGTHGSADEDTIGGMAPSAVTNAPPPDIDVPVDIGGVTPDAVTDAAPPVQQEQEQDTLARRTATAPADTTVVSPGMETPYIQRQDRAGQTAAGRPVTDDDIIAEGLREREQQGPPDRPDQFSQSADRDVAPDADEASPAERGG